MYYALTILFFGLCFALKGGSGPYIFGWWKRVREKNKFTERLLDGKVVSTILAFLFAVVVYSTKTGVSSKYGVPTYSVDIWPPVLFSLGWLASVTPSLGEEHGAIGRIGKAWGPYIDKGFGRSYGVKKGLQRGVWMGACMAVATGFVPYLCASFLYVPTVFLGQELYYRVTGKDSWVLSEPLVGALIFGVPTALMVLA